MLKSIHPANCKIGNFLSAEGEQGFNSQPLGAIINIPSDTPLLAAGQSVFHVNSVIDFCKLKCCGSILVDQYCFTMEKSLL
jgi:hypothetical protein